MLTPAARVVAHTVTETVAAAGDPDAFAAASARLVALDREQVRILLGTLIRLLLEESHPDGLGSEVLQDVVRRVVTNASPWFDVDPAVLVVVLVGALGADDESDTPPTPADHHRHAAVTTAELLRTAPRPLAPVLADALADRHRAETLDYQS